MCVLLTIEIDTLVVFIVCLPFIVLVFPFLVYKKKRRWCGSRKKCSFIMLSWLLCFAAGGRRVVFESN